VKVEVEEEEGDSGVTIASADACDAICVQSGPKLQLLRRRRPVVEGARRPLSSSLSPEGMGRTGGESSRRGRAGREGGRGGEEEEEEEGPEDSDAPVEEGPRVPDREIWWGHERIRREGRGEG